MTLYLFGSLVIQVCLFQLVQQVFEYNHRFKLFVSLVNGKWKLASLIIS